jgi:SRSO17 transposase
VAVHILPAFLQALLGFASGLLSLPQQRLLHQLTLAWLLGSGGKLIRAAQITAGRHRTSLARFLNKSSWDAVAVLTQTTIGVLRGMRPRSGEVLYLILDDTRNAKRGRKMPAVKKIWDHAAQQFVRGHIIVTAAILFRGVTLPWRFTLWLPEEYCKTERLKFRRQTDIAAELIRAFTPPKGVKVRVLFDAFYLCKPVTGACESQGFTWFSVASRNRLLTRDRGAKRNIGELAAGILKHQGQRVRMKRARGWRWLRIATVVGRLNKIGDVRVVFSKRPRDPWKNLVAMVTNETRLSAREVVANYERRWAIEVLFKELKGTLGLGEYQMQTRQGIERHLHVCGLAHLALTHHSLRTVGAQAKRANKDVPLPKFQERLESLRAAVRRNRVGRFVNRIRHKKIRNRVREYLLADE